MTRHSRPATALGNGRGVRTQAVRAAAKQPKKPSRFQIEERYAALFSLAPVGIAQLNLDRELEFVNDALCDILGYERDQLIGRRLRDFSHPDDNELTDAVVADLIASEARRSSVEKRFLRRDGSIVWTKLTMTLARNGSGPPTHRIVVIEDIDARKQAEERLARITALHLATNQVNEAILRAGSPAELLRAACGILVKQGDFDVASVRIANNEKGVLELIATAGKQAKWVSDRESRTGPVRVDGPGLAGEVYRTGRPCVIDDLEKELTIAARITYSKQAGFASSAGFPLKRAGATIGSLMVASLRKNAFDKDLIVLFEQVADNLSFALEKFAQEADRARAEQALRESEARFRSMVELANDVYWEQDAEHRFVNTSDIDEEAGMIRQAVTGRRRWEMTNAVALSCSWEEHRALLEARKPFRNFEFRHQWQDGTVRYISANGEPVFDAEGRFSGYRGTARNITAEKRDQEALLRFRTALDQSSDFVILSEAVSARILDINDAVCAALGYARGELIGKALNVLIAGRSLESIVGRRRESNIVAPGQHDQIRSTWRRKDGSTLEVEVQRQCIASPDGPIVVSISRDLTSRLAAERTIQRHVLRQECTARFGRLALGEKDVAELARCAVQAVETGLGVSDVVLLEISEARQLLVRAASEGMPMDPGAQIAAAPGLVECIAALESTGIHQGDECRKVAGWIPASRADDFRSVLICPFRVGEAQRLLLAALAREESVFSLDDCGFVEAIASLLSTALQRHESEMRLARLAQFDSLTGLANRSLLSDRLTQAIAQANRQRWSGAVLFVDLDRFKQVNDTLGHARGDQLLAEAARRLQDSVRDGDSVARISGDEFAIVLANLTRAEDAAVVAQKVLDALARPFQLGDREAMVSGSIGIAVFPENGQDADTLLTLADSAMYQAKESGRNAYCFFSIDMSRRS